MIQNPPNHRTAHRFLAGLKGTLLLGEKRFTCRTLDLHRLGVMVEGEFDAAGHTSATVVLQSSSDLSFEAHGRVTHVFSDPTSGYTHLGLEFESIAPDQNESLERLIARVIEGMNPEPLAHLERGASVAEIRDALSKIPLVHRITLAHRALPKDRGFLKHDESPQVIEALCRNPQITMPEVMQILRFPMLLPTTLEFLSRDARWTANEEIRIVIATHPRVTFPTADRLVKTLSLVGIRRVIRRPGLNPAIKDRLVQTIPHKQLQGW